MLAYCVWWGAYNTQIFIIYITSQLFYLLATYTNSPLDSIDVYISKSPKSGMRMSRILFYGGAINSHVIPTYLKWHLIYLPYLRCW